MTALATLFVPDDETAVQPTQLVTASYDDKTTRALQMDAADHRYLQKFKRISYRFLPHWVFPETINTKSSSSIRSAAVSDFLKEQRVNCTDWHRKNLPGVFTQDPDLKELPGIQLLLTELVKPMRIESDWNGSFRALGFQYSFLSWKPKPGGEWRLAFPDSAIAEHSSSAITVGCRRSNVIPSGVLGYPSHDNWALSQHLDDYLKDVLARWGCSQLLDTLQRRLVRTRDKIASSSRRGAVGQLKRLRRFLVVEASDCEVAASETARLIKDGFHTGMDVVPLITAELSLPGGRTRQEVELYPALHQDQLQKCEQLLSDCQTMVTSLSAAANTSSAISNTRLQRWVTLLAVIAIVVAIWAALRNPGSG
jgi:hypothetical protein